MPREARTSSTPSRARAVTVAGALVFALTFAVVPGACAPRSGMPATTSTPSSASTPATASDSARGVVDVVGPEPGSLVLRGATQAIALDGPLAGELRAAAGLEIVVHGVRASTGESAPLPAARISVSRYAVRAASGTPAVDGVLATERAGYVLRLSEGGSAPLPALPAGLRAAVGARIYLAGPLDRAPTAYGVLRAP